MDHDRLFKELLSTFFLEFLELFTPELAAQVEPGSLELLDKEILTDLGRGSRHVVDLLGKVRLRGQAACVVVHVETQASRKPDFARRLFHYFALLGFKLGLPVFPVVVFSYAQPRNREPDCYRLQLPGLDVLRFRFRAVQLNRLGWRAYLRQPNPVAAALMARMRIAAQDRPRVKVQCLRLITTLRLDRARMHLLTAFVDSYLRLDAREAKLFDKEMGSLPADEREKAMELTTSWKEEGRREGREEGRQEGRQEGTTSMVLRLLGRRVGRLPKVLAARVRALPLAALEGLAEALLDFGSQGDLRHWLDSRG